ncbi:hypothetical protein [Bartonella sp. F02]|uniref:hypothetical protein n=1 Tax=Bartonella sp. F02 TaxID=2967262 RepID=UPI0022A93542|nr:hypothetical protein [Bartonella sp. F02]MCZ2328797.1 hypothetical protein [Bartonella sp. F02]
MCIFSNCFRKGKIKKHIAHLKNELTPNNHWFSNNNNTGALSSMFNTWKQKGRHALYHLNEHTEELKNKVKENPKTTIALAMGVALTSFLFMRKK